MSGYEAPIPGRIWTPGSSERPDGKREHLFQAHLQASHAPIAQHA